MTATVAHRIRLRPNISQRINMAKAAGVSRWTHNWALSRKTSEFRTTGRSPSAVDLSREITILKNTPIEMGGYPWLSEVSAWVPIVALRNLDILYQAFYNMLNHTGKTGFPRYKRKQLGVGGFSLYSSVKVTYTHIFLTRIGWVRIAPGNRGYAPNGKYKSVRLVQEHGEWYASVNVEVQETQPVPDSVLPQVGIDLGVRKLVTMAAPNGLYKIIPNRRALLKAARKLRRAQKVVSRRKKGSNRRRRAVRALGRVHQRVKNIRKDATHKATTAIAQRFAVVAMEDLKVSNMTRRGHGKGRKAKAGLNRVLLDANPGEIRRQLEYKLRLKGGRIVLVDPAYTSQRCSACGGFSNVGSNETYTCATCLTVLDRDVNAARNILTLGRGEVVAASWSETQNARGEVVRRWSLRAPAQASMKREHSGGQLV